MLDKTPETFSVTAESDPELWAILQPPEPSPGFVIEPFPTDLAAFVGGLVDASEGSDSNPFDPSLENVEWQAYEQGAVAGGLWE